MEHVITPPETVQLLDAELTAIKAGNDATVRARLALADATIAQANALNVCAQKDRELQERINMIASSHGVGEGWRIDLEAGQFVKVAK
jgi:hypothetical protein